MPAVGRLSVGLKHYSSQARVWRTLHSVIGDPRVPAWVECEIPGTANQKSQLVATGVVDLDCYCPGIGHDNKRRRIQVTQQRQRVDSSDILPRVAGEVRQRLRGIV